MTSRRDPVALIRDRLAGVRKSGSGWIAQCPAHPDKSPSLSIREGERGVILKCWIGCTVPAIVDALGLRQSDLFYGALAAPQQQRASKAVLKACVSESIVVIASSRGGVMPKQDHIRLRTAALRLRAALTLDGLPGRRAIEGIARYAALLLNGQTLTEDEVNNLTGSVQWIGWLIADEHKPGVTPRREGETAYAEQQADYPR